MKYQHALVSALRTLTREELELFAAYQAEIASRMMDDPESGGMSVPCPPFEFMACTFEDVEEVTTKVARLAARFNLGTN